MNGLHIILQRIIRPLEQMRQRIWRIPSVAAALLRDYHFSWPRDKSINVNVAKEVLSRNFRIRLQKKKNATTDFWYNRIESRHNLINIIILWLWSLSFSLYRDFNPEYPIKCIHSKQIIKYDLRIRGREMKRLFSECVGGGDLEIRF